MVSHTIVAVEHSAQSLCEHPTTGNAGRFCGCRARADGASDVTMKPPIFVIGNARSGTTLLRLMLNNHSNIVVPPECGFAVWWYEKYKSWSKDCCHDPRLVGQFVQDLSTSRKIETWQLDYSALREFISLEQPQTYPELVSCMYVFYANSTGRAIRRWGDKNNFHVDWIKLLSDMFRDACFIHIARDGRDVACSYRDMGILQSGSQYAPRLPTDIAHIAAEWTANLDKVILSFEQIGWDRACEVRYEDLVTNNRSELTRICEFLGEPYDERMLDYYVYNAREHQEPTEFLAWKRRTLEKPTTSQVGRFRRELTDEEIGVFETHASALLERYGYERGR